MDVVVAFDADDLQRDDDRGLRAVRRVMPIGSGGGLRPLTAGPGVSTGRRTRVYAAQLPCDESPVDRVLVFDGRHCHAGDLSGCGDPVASVEAGRDPFGLAVDEGTRTLYAPLLRNGEDNGAVAVIDIRRCNGTTTSGCGQLVALAPAGFGSLGVAVDARSHDVYVTNDEDASVGVVDGVTCRAGRPRAAVAPRPTCRPTTTRRPGSGWPRRCGRRTSPARPAAPCRCCRCCVAGRGLDHAWSRVAAGSHSSTRIQPPWLPTSRDGVHDAALPAGRRTPPLDRAAPGAGRARHAPSSA